MVQTPLKIQRIDTRQGKVESALAALRDKLSLRGDIVSEQGRQRTLEVFGKPLSPQQVVETICKDVQRGGLDAVLRYSRQIDRAELDATTLRVSDQELQDAHQQADPQFLKTVRRIRDNIFEFQRAILHQDVELHKDGISLKQRYVPLRRIGVCVPGGAAAYPSTVLMSAVPALAAGVREIALVAPPTRFGANNPDVLATCYELGVAEVYRIGGAQAVAALAYGVEGLPAVDKVVGPGNLFVALAKKFVYGEVDIDSSAGPSEVVVIADETARPDFTAADLLAQAEHSPGSALLITWIPELLDSVGAELQRQVTELSRSQLTIDSLEQFGALILVRDAAEACSLTDLIAPEHLHIAAENATEMAKNIRNAGATFLGHYSPVALGDYIAGPSHVLPTGGTARWASGLSANDFLRSGSVIQYSHSALQEAADDLRRMTDKEQLTAHWASVEIRLKKKVDG